MNALAKSTSTLARPDHFSHHLLSVLETHEVSDSFEIQMTDGRVITELDYPVRDRDGHFIGHLWVYEDITRERQTAEQLVYLAERDALTGLYNRHRFQQELTRTMLDTDRHQLQCAVMFFDLDEFKTINDTYGHRAGDALLIRVAGEIGALVRRNEVLARLGGDEFAILLPAVQEQRSRSAGRARRPAIAQIPFRFEGPQPARHHQPRHCVLPLACRRCRRAGGTCRHCDVSGQAGRQKYLARVPCRPGGGYRNA